jgi:hypothetical protein
MMPPLARRRESRVVRGSCHRCSSRRTSGTSDTGMSQPDAEQRVNQVIEKARATKAEAEQKAKEAADAARKAGMYTALWAAVAMLAGAFSAALAVTWCGRARDT